MKGIKIESNKVKLVNVVPAVSLISTIVSSIGVGTYLAGFFFTGGLIYLLTAMICAMAIIAFQVAATEALPSEPSVRIVTKEIEKKVLVCPPPIPYGVIYVMRRSDGVYKIGKTHYLRNRLRSHRIDYGQGFDVVASWVVPNADSYERTALGLTQQYAYSEGNRRELRRMSETELSQFVLSFTERVYDGLKKTAQN